MANETNGTSEVSAEVSGEEQLLQFTALLAAMLGIEGAAAEPATAFKNSINELAAACGNTGNITKYIEELKKLKKEFEDFNKIAQSLDVTKRFNEEDKIKGKIENLFTKSNYDKSGNVHKTFNKMQEMGMADEEDFIDIEEYFSKGTTPHQKPVNNKNNNTQIANEVTSPLTYSSTSTQGLNYNQTKTELNGTPKTNPNKQETSEDLNTTTSKLSEVAKVVDNANTSLKQTTETIKNQTEVIKAKNPTGSNPTGSNLTKQDSTNIKNSDNTKKSNNEIIAENLITTFKNIVDKFNIQNPNKKFSYEGINNSNFNVFKSEFTVLKSELEKYNAKEKAEEKINDDVNQKIIDNNLVSNLKNIIEKFNLRNPDNQFKAGYIDSNNFDITKSAFITHKSKTAVSDEAQKQENNAAALSEKITQLVYKIQKFNSENPLNKFSVNGDITSDNYKQVFEQLKTRKAEVAANTAKPNRDDTLLQEWEVKDLRIKAVRAGIDVDSTEIKTKGDAARIQNEIRNKPYDIIENSYTSIRALAGKNAETYKSTIFDNIDKIENPNIDRNSLKENVNKEIDVILQNYDKVLQEKYVNLLRSNKSPENLANKFQNWKNTEDFSELYNLLNKYKNTLNLTNQTPAASVVQTTETLNREKQDSQNLINDIRNTTLTHTGYITPTKELLRNSKFVPTPETQYFMDNMSFVGNDYGANSSPDKSKKQEIEIHNQKLNENIEKLTKTLEAADANLKTFEKIEEEARRRRENVYTNASKVANDKNLRETFNTKNALDWAQNYIHSDNVKFAISSLTRDPSNKAAVNTASNINSAIRKITTQINNMDNVSGLQEALNHSATPEELKKYFDSLDKDQKESITNTAQRFQSLFHLIDRQIDETIRRNSKTKGFELDPKQKEELSQLKAASSILRNFAYSIPDADKNLRKANMNTLHAQSRRNSASRELRKANQEKQDIIDEIYGTGGFFNGIKKGLDAYSQSLLHKGGLKGAAIKGISNMFGNTYMSHFGGDIEQYTDENGKVKERFVGGLNLTAISAGTAITAISKLGKVLLELGKDSMAAYGDIESIKTNLSVVYGSSSQANSTFEDISNYALKSPFGVKQTSEFAVLLKQSGVYSSELLDTLKMIGDVAGGNAEKYTRIANNYAQIVAAGKATAMDLRQFANAGLPIYQEIRKELGISQQEVRKMTQEGKISIGVIEKVFKNMTSEGGTFFNAVERGSKTYKARVQNMADAKQLAKASAGEWIYNLGGSGNNDSLFQQILNLEEIFFSNVKEYFSNINLDKSINNLSKKVATNDTLLEIYKNTSDIKEKAFLEKTLGSSNLIEDELRSANFKKVNDLFNTVYETEDLKNNLNSLSSRYKTLLEEGKTEEAETYLNGLLDYFANDNKTRFLTGTRTDLDGATVLEDILKNGLTSLTTDILEEGTGFKRAGRRWTDVRNSDINDYLTGKAENFTLASYEKIQKNDKLAEASVTLAANARELFKQTASFRNEQLKAQFFKLNSIEDRQTKELKYNTEDLNDFSWMKEARSDMTADEFKNFVKNSFTADSVLKIIPRDLLKGTDAANVALNKVKDSLVRNKNFSINYIKTLGNAGDTGEGFEKVADIVKKYTDAISELEKSSSEENLNNVVKQITNIEKVAKTLDDKNPLKDFLYQIVSNIGHTSLKNFDVNKIREELNANTRPLWERIFQEVLAVPQEAILNMTKENRGQLALRAYQNKQSRVENDAIFKAMLKNNFSLEQSLGNKALANPIDYKSLAEQELKKRRKDFKNINEYSTVDIPIQDAEESLTFKKFSEKETVQTEINGLEKELAGIVNELGDTPSIFIDDVKDRIDSLYQKLNYQKLKEKIKTKYATSSWSSGTWVVDPDGKSYPLENDVSAKYNVSAQDVENTNLINSPSEPDILSQNESLISSIQDLDKTLADNDWLLGTLIDETKMMNEGIVVTNEDGSVNQSLTNENFRKFALSSSDYSTSAVTKAFADILNQEQQVYQNIISSSLFKTEDYKNLTSDEISQQLEYGSSKEAVEKVENELNAIGLSLFNNDKGFQQLSNTTISTVSALQNFNANLLASANVISRWKSNEESNNIENDKNKLETDIAAGKYDKYLNFIKDKTESTSDFRDRVKTTLSNEIGSTEVREAAKRKNLTPLQYIESYLNLLGTDRGLKNPGSLNSQIIRYSTDQSVETQKEFLNKRIATANEHYLSAVSLEEGESTPEMRALYNSILPYGVNSLEDITGAVSKIAEQISVYDKTIRKLSVKDKVTLTDNEKEQLKTANNKKAFLTSEYNTMKSYETTDFMKDNLQKTDELGYELWAFVDLLRSSTKRTAKKNTANFRPLWERLSTQTLGIPAQILSALNNKGGSLGYENGKKITDKNQFIGSYFKSMNTRSENTSIAKAMLASGVSPIALASMIKQQKNKNGTDKYVGIEGFNRTKAVNQNTTNTTLRSFALDEKSSKSVTDAMLTSIGESINKIDTFFASAAFQIEDASMGVEDYAAQLDKKTYDSALQAWNQLGYGYNELGKLKDDVNAFSLSLKEGKDGAKTFEEFLPNYLDGYRKNLKALQESTATLSAFKSVFDSFLGESFKEKQEQYNLSASARGSYITGNEDFDSAEFDIQKEIITKLQEALNSQSSLKAVADVLTSGQGFSVQMIENLIGQYGTDLSTYSNNADKIAEKLAKENGVTDADIAASKTVAGNQLTELSKQTTLLAGIYKVLGGDSNDLLKSNKETAAKEKRSIAKPLENVLENRELKNQKELETTKSLAKNDIGKTSTETKVENSENKSELKDFVQYLIKSGGIKDETLNKSALDILHSKGATTTDVNKIAELISNSFISAEERREAFRSASSDRWDYFEKYLKDLNFLADYLADNKEYEIAKETYNLIKDYYNPDGIDKFYMGTKDPEALKLNERYISLRGAENRYFDQKDYPGRIDNIKNGTDEYFNKKLENILSGFIKPTVYSSTTPTTEPSPAPRINSKKESITVKNEVAKTYADVLDEVIDIWREEQKTGNITNNGYNKYISSSFNAVDLKNRLFQNPDISPDTIKNGLNFGGKTDLNWMSGANPSSTNYLEQQGRIYIEAKNVSVDTEHTEVDTPKEESPDIEQPKVTKDLLDAAKALKNDKTFTAFKKYSINNGYNNPYGANTSDGINTNGGVKIEGTLATDTKSDSRFNWKDFSNFFDGANFFNIFGNRTRKVDGSSIDRHGYYDKETDSITWNTAKEERALTYLRENYEGFDSIKTSKDLSKFINGTLDTGNEAGKALYEKTTDGKSGIDKLSELRKKLDNKETLSDEEKQTYNDLSALDETLQQTNSFLAMLQNMGVDSQGLPFFNKESQSYQVINEEGELEDVDTSSGTGTTGSILTKGITGKLSLEESNKFAEEQLKGLEDRFSGNIFSGMTSGLSDSLEMWGQMTKQGKSLGDIIDSFKDKWKEVGASMMKTIGADMTSTGLKIAGAQAMEGNWGGVAAGLALAASGGIMSFTSGILSGSSDDDDDDGSEQKIQSLKDALSELIDQAKTDAEYYQKNLLHKNALASNEAVSTRSVNDAIITPNGSVVTTHPDDYLIATKTPGSLINAGNKGGNYSPNITFSVINASGQNVEISDTEESVDEYGNVDIRATIVAVAGEAIASGELDDAFSAMQYRQQGSPSVAG